MKEKIIPYGATHTCTVQAATISVESLCKQLEDMNPHKEKEGGNKQKWIRFGVWNNCVTIVRSLLQGKIITTEQAISDVWDAAIAWYEGELERGTPLPNKATYLKEKFNTTSQPVKTNEDINVRDTIKKAFDLISGEPSEQNVSDAAATLFVLLNYLSTSVKGEEQEKDLGTCVECKREPATVDYNGHGHYVCQICYKHLTNEFEDEYK